MKLESLRRFVLIAHEKNMSKAALKVNVSQSTLSRDIAELEEELGAKIFDREHRLLRLTEIGHYLFSRAEEIISLNDQTVLEIQQSGMAVKGDIYIGAGETIAMNEIAKKINAIHLDYPQIKFHVISGDGQEVIRRLDNGLIDFGVVIDPIDRSSYHSTTLSLKDEWGILVPNYHSLADKPFVTKEQLIKEPLIISRQTGVDHRLSKWFQTEVNNLNIVATFNLMYNASILTKHNLGITIGFKDLIQVEDSTTLSYVPLKPFLKENVHIIWKKDKQLNSASQILLQTFRENE